jgi:hypothetical protein
MFGNAQRDTTLEMYKVEIFNTRSENPRILEAIQELLQK